MEKYLGVKIIHAEPMTQGQAWAEKNNGISCCSPDNDPDGYKVVYEDGYVSWSPKDVFEKAYRRIDNLTFGLAVEALKQGKKVARKGWNGKGMWLIRISGKTGELPRGANSLLPFIGMKTVDDAFVPWLASQIDILAEDWEIVE